MVESMQNQIEYELSWKKQEINKLLKENNEQTDEIKQWIRFSDIAKFANDYRSTTSIDLGEVAKIEDNEWRIVLYMKEKGKGKEDTYYVLNFYKEINKFKLSIAHWKDLWWKFEKNEVVIANKFLTPQEADVILKKFEKQVKKQKDSKILEQNILWK